MAIAATVATMGLASVSGLGLVSAASSTSGNDSLVDKIAQKFNLNKADVQKVFDDNKSAHKAEHQAEVSNKLQKAVDGGKLTSEQKTLIENKLKEFQTARDTERKELETWAQQNGIDAKYLMPRGMHGGDKHLQGAVDNDKLTSEQKTLIENKLSELKDKRKSTHDELEKWAKDNKIDMKYLMPEHGRGPKGGGPF